MKKKDLSKLVALAVLFGGVTLSRHAWAEEPVLVYEYFYGNQDYSSVGGTDLSGVTDGIQLQLINTDNATITFNGSSFTPTTWLPATDPETQDYSSIAAISVASGDVSNGKTIILDGIISETITYDTLRIYGGFSKDGKAEGNEVSIQGGTFSTLARVIGGQSDGVGAATNSSKVSIRAGILIGLSDGGLQIYGALSYLSTDGNIIEISGGTLSNVNVICGAETSGSSDSTNSKVTISGGEITGISTGSYMSIYGANSGRGFANGDIIEISGGTLSNAGTIMGAYGFMGATNNKVTISGGEITGRSTGASMFGGYQNCNKGESNIIEILGGTLNNVNIIAGCGSANSSIMSNNTVALLGGTLNGTVNVYGAYVFRSGGASLKNIVTIGDKFQWVKENYSDTFNLYGSNCTLSIDNTLTVDGKNIAVTSVQNFESYLFCIPAEIDGSTPMLKTTNAITLTETDIIKVIADQSIPDTVILANNVTGTVPSGATYDLSNGNIIISGVRINGSQLLYDKGTVTQWINVQPGTLSGNTAVLDGSKNGSNNPLATVNGGTQTFKAGDSGKTEWQNVYGGYSSVQGAVTANNSVTVSGTATIEGNVYGSYSANGNVIGNTVNIQGGKITGSVYGGKSDNSEATVTGNIINWFAGTVEGSEIKANNINIMGTAAKYLGTVGTITADGNVVLGNGTNAATFIVGDGSAASALTFASGLDAKEKSIFTIAKNSSATLQGTSTLAGTVNVKGTLTNGGTLNLDGVNLDTQNDAISDLNVDNVMGTNTLAIDVDMSSFIADKLTVAAVTDTPTITLTDINVTADYDFSSGIEFPKTEDNKITYVDGDAQDSITYNIAQSPFVITADAIVYTGNYKYTFTKGTAGTLNYTVEAADVTFKKLVEGKLASGTLSLTGYFVNGAEAGDITQGTTTPITVNLNGHNLISTNTNNIVVGTGKTFNLNGGNGTNAGTTDGKTNFNVAGTLVISGKIKMAGAISGAGTVTNSDTLTIEDASKIQVTGTNGLENTGTINLGGATASTLGGKISGGTLKITGNVSTDADNIQSDTNTVVSGLLTLIDTGTLAKSINGSVKNTGTLTASLDKFTELTKFENAGTLKLSGNLTGNIFGAGTTELQSNITVTANRSVAGTLDGNGKTIDMQEGSGTADYSTLNVGKLTGTTDMKIDVDLKAGTSDKLHITGTEVNNCTLNLTSINVRKDQEVNPTLLPETYTDALTYTDGKTDGITFKLNGKTKAESGLIGVGTATSDNYIYNFTLGNAGKLDYTVSATDVTFKKFVKGDLGDTVTTLSLNGDMISKGDITAITQGKTELTVNLNGHNLKSETASKVIVGTNKFNLNGGNGETYGTTDANTSFEVAATGTLAISGKTTVNGTITNAGTMTTAGTTTLNGEVTNNNSFTNYGNTTINAKLDGTGTLDNTGTLNITAANLGNAVTNNGTVNLGAGTLSEIVNGGELNITDDVSTATVNIISPTSVSVATDKVLTLTSGELLFNITNAGTVKLDGATLRGALVTTGTLEFAKDITTNADYVAATINKVDGGVTLTLTGDNKTLGQKVSGAGKVVIDGTISADADRFTQTGGLEVKDTLKFTAKRMNMTNLGEFTQTDCSNVVVPVEVIQADTNNSSKAMLTGLNAAGKLDVKNGNLKVNKPVTDGQYYVLVAGTAVADGTLQAADLWKKENIVLDTSKYFLADFDYVINGNAIAIKVQGATVEEANTSGLAAVQQGALAVSKEFTGEVENHLGMIANPKLADKEKYDKEVWATYINTKETTEGMKLGAGIEGNNTAKYSGAVVGVDFYSSKKSIAGLAFSYTKGDVDSYSGATATKNDAKYYGVSLYNRVTNGNTALIYDIGYIRGNNDVSQYYNGKPMTSDVKTNTYTAGARAEAAIETGKSRVVPFAAFRYMRVNNGDYTNSHNTRFETKNQNLYIQKVGIAWTGDFVAPNSVCTWRPSVEVGYLWNLGDRSAESNVLLSSRITDIGYDIADRNSFYGKAGIELMSRNFTAGVFYRYLKGNAVKNNKWNVNMAWSF